MMRTSHKRTLVIALVCAMAFSLFGAAFPLALGGASGFRIAYGIKSGEEGSVQTFDFRPVVYDASKPDIDGVTLTDAEGLEAVQTAADFMKLSNKDSSEYLSLSALNAQNPGAAKLSAVTYGFGEYAKKMSYYRLALDVSKFSAEELKVRFESGFSAAGAQLIAEFAGVYDGTGLIPADDAAAVSVIRVSPVGKPSSAPLRYELAMTLQVGGKQCALDPGLNSENVTGSIGISYKKGELENAGIYESILNNVSLNSRSIKSILDQAGEDAMADMSFVGDQIKFSFPIPQPMPDPKPDYLFGFDGKDQIVIKAGTVFPYGFTAKEEISFQYTKGTQEPALGTEADPSQNAWDRFTPAEAGAITLTKLPNAPKLSVDLNGLKETDMVRFSFPAFYADGSAAKLGMYENLETQESVSGQIKINDRTIFQLNESEQLAKVSFLGGNVVLSVRKDQLELDGTDTFEFAEAFAAEGFTIEAGAFEDGVRKYFYYPKDGFLTTEEPASAMPGEIGITLGSVGLKEENKLVIGFEFSDNISNVLHHMENVYAQTDWIFANFSNIYGTREDDVVSGLVTKGVLSSLMDKLSFKFADDSRFVTYREIVDNKRDGKQTICHFGVSASGGGSTTSINLCFEGSEWNINEDFTVKMEAGFVFPFNKKLDKDYVYYYNNEYNVLYPDRASAVKKAVTLRSISDVKTGEAGQSFYLEFARDAFYFPAQVADPSVLLDRIEINGMSISELNALNTSKATVKYGYVNEETNLKIVLHIAIPKGFAGGFRLDGTDVLSIAKNFETDSRIYLKEAKTAKLGADGKFDLGEIKAEQESSGFPAWAIVAIAAGALLIVEIAAAALILKKKKSAQDTAGGEK